jgi:hypothetical protein
MYSYEIKFSITMFAYAKKYTPILNRSDFSKILMESSLYDQLGHVRFLEMIAFPGEKFQIVQRLGKNVAEVVIPSYPTNLPMYLDIRCVSYEYTPKKMFTQTYEKIVESLFKYPKRPYLLGGNCSLPLYEWASWYPPKVQDPYRRMISHLDGVDCSGILYELTLGNLPRNTSDLIHFCEKTNKLAPLDIFIKPGHVIIYLGNDTLLESRQFDGVVFSSYNERRSELEKEYEMMHWYSRLNPII